MRLGLFLAEVGRAENIEVSQEELQRGLLAEMRNYPGQEQAIFEFYQKNPSALVNLRGPLLEEKVVDHILEKAKVTERQTDRAGLMAALEAIDSTPEGSASSASASGGEEATAEEESTSEEKGA